MNFGEYEFVASYAFHQGSRCIWSNSRVAFALFAFFVVSGSRADCYTWRCAYCLEWLKNFSTWQTNGIRISPFSALGAIHAVRIVLRIQLEVWLLSSPIDLTLHIFHFMHGCFLFFNAGLFFVFFPLISAYRQPNASLFSLLHMHPPFSVFFFFFNSSMQCANNLPARLSVCAQNHSLKNLQFSIVACVLNNCNYSINLLVRSISSSRQFCATITKKGGPAWSSYILSFCLTIVTHFLNDRVKIDIILLYW